MSGDVQYRLVVRKGDERVEGPDDAALVVTTPIAIVTDPDFDATVEFMRGRLKATGHTGLLFEVLSSGVAATSLISLASTA